MYICIYYVRIMKIICIHIYLLSFTYVCMCVCMYVRIPFAQTICASMTAGFAHTCVHMHNPFHAITLHTQHTKIPTCRHTHTSTCTPTQKTSMHACMCACMSTYIPTYLHTYVHTHMIVRCAPPSPPPAMVSTHHIHGPAALGACAEGPCSTEREGGWGRLNSEAQDPSRSTGGQGG